MKNFPFPSDLRTARIAILAAALAMPAAADDYHLQLPASVTRPFLAPELWTTPMMDWQLTNGRIEMSEPGRAHDVQLLTHQLTSDDGRLRMSVRLGQLKDHTSEREPGLAGFKFAVTGGMPDEYRSGLFGSEGLLAGVSTRGRLIIGGRTSPTTIHARHLADLILELEADCRGSQAGVTLIARDSASGRELDRYSATVSRKPLRGNLGLVVQGILGGGAGKAKGGGRDAGGRFQFWFRDWTVGGDKVRAHPEQTFGPVLWSQYTVHAGVLKLTAHFVPLGPGENQVAFLELDRGRGWERAASTTLDPLARTAEFRIENWDATVDTRYRIVFDWLGGGGPATAYWAGTVRRDPVDRAKVSVAVLSCMVDYAFPNQYVAANVREQDPDLVFFAGDQIYEGVGGYSVVRTASGADVPRAALNYLGKYWLFGWSFREVLRDRPSVIIPDDHDVYHGNIWGRGGAAMPRSGSTSSTGGYNMHPRWVNMIQRTQTSHLPDPVDPAPVKQGIGVYFTNLHVGRISFAILEDRKFKSAPGDALITPLGGSKRLDHIMDPDFDTTQLDKPGLELLGSRQMRFLEAWAADFCGVDFKAVLSQTPLCAVATTHGTASGRLAADMDANGWPQTPRDDALRAIRKAHAIMLHGDQHLASLVLHGVDDWNDSGWSYTSPGLANGYKRIWDPLVPGKNRRPGMPEYTGEFRDGFRNRITVWAAANRIDTLNPNFELKSDSMVDRLNSTGSGYGIIRFDRENLAITVESWPIHPSLAAVGGGAPRQHEGWPRTLTVEDQYARPAAGWLPPIAVAAGERPAIQVIHEGTGEIVYTRRVRDSGFRPKVFDLDSTYTVLVGEIGGVTGVRKWIGLKPVKD